MSQQINLFNPIFLKTKKMFSAVSLFQASGLLILGTAMVGAYLNYQTTQLTKSAALITAQLNTAETQAAKLRATAVSHGESKSLEDNLKNLDNDIENRKKITAILQKNDFGNTRGYSNYLVALARQIPNGVWLTGFDITGGDSHISIQGRTFKPELVPAYVSQLKRESVMQGRSFATLKMQSPQLLASSNGTGGAARSGSDQQKDQSGYIEFELSSLPMSEKNSAAGANGK